MPSKRRRTVSRTFTIYDDQYVKMYTLQEDHGMEMNEVVRNALDEYIPAVKADFERAEKLAEKRTENAQYIGNGESKDNYEGAEEENKEPKEEEMEEAGTE